MTQQIHGIIKVEEKKGIIIKKFADGKLILGFRHVFDSLKHNMDFSKLIRPEGSKSLFGIDAVQVED